jgi:hypothetical protein
LAEFLPLEYESSGLESVVKPHIMAEGSRNVLITGSGKPSGFKGVTVQAGKLGNRVMMNAGESYAGLGSYSQSAIKGSVVRVMAGLFFAGTGTLHYDGASLGVSVIILQLRLRQEHLAARPIRRG